VPFSRVDQVVRAVGAELVRDLVEHEELAFRPTKHVSAIPVERRYSSALAATRRGSPVYDSRVTGSTISQITDSVGVSQNGSRSAVDATGISSMSDSEMPCQPRIEEPSKPSPSSKASSPNALRGSVMCCQVPSRSQNLRSTIFALVSPAHSSASRGAAPLST